MSTDKTITPPQMISAADPAAKDLALAELQRGGLVAIPTETVYGLAADATDPHAVARIFAAKGRPQFNPLISHIWSLDVLGRYAETDDRALRLAEMFWPGSLTIVLPRNSECPIAVITTAGLDTVAIRCPDNAFTRDLARSLERPLAAPSANPSGRLSPTEARHVQDNFSAEQLALVIDGGPCSVGLESTVVAVLPNQPVTILRPGFVTKHALQEVLPEEKIQDFQPGQSDDNSPSSPGQLSSHYAPHAPLFVVDETTIATARDAVLNFGDTDIPGSQHAMASANLSASADLLEAAATLFGHLHRLDAARPDRILVRMPPANGLGIAIRDRLQRAAYPRNS